MSSLSDSRESCTDLPNSGSKHPNTNNTISLKGNRKKTFWMNILFVMQASIMMSRLSSTNAFLSRIPKSATTQRLGESARNHLHSRITPAFNHFRQRNRLYKSYNINEDIAEFSSTADGGYNRPAVQWYPGHIAKAERQLSETLKVVDVVVEVRDARACKATAHPRVGEWCAGRPRIVVLTHLDMVPKAASSTWRKAYETLGAESWDEAPINKQVANQAKQARQFRSRFDVNGGPGSSKKKNRDKNVSYEEKIEMKRSNITPVEQVLFVNAKQGQGIHALHRAIFKAGAHVQERRERRGLNPRALRVGIIGYPNVGKVRELYVASKWRSGMIDSCERYP